jgi:maltooligosyltrehalose trehalohydrolase
VLDSSEPLREPHAGVLRWYRDLLALRRREPALRDPRLDRVAVAFDDEQHWVAVTRGTLRVTANLAQHEQEVPLDGVPQEVLLASAPAQLRPDAVRLPAESVAVVRVSG